MDGDVTLIREAAPLDQAEKPRRYRGAKEVDLRNAVERWGRARWPEARVCHELVLNRGTTRLDVAFVSPDRLAVVELKSGYDVMDRAIHQTAFARLCGCEAWLICDTRFSPDLRLIRFLLPTIGIAQLTTVDQHGHVLPGGEHAIEVVAEPDLATRPHPEAQAAVLWVAELCRALGIGGSKPPTHASLMKRLAALPDAERTALVCRELRGRDALWRADPPIRHAQPVKE